MVSDLKDGDGPKAAAEEIRRILKLSWGSWRIPELGWAGLGSPLQSPQIL